MRRPEVQSAFQFILKVFSGVEFRAQVSKYPYGAHFVHKVVVMLEQISSSEPHTKTSCTIVYLHRARPTYEYYNQLSTFFWPYCIVNMGMTGMTIKCVEKCWDSEQHVILVNW